MHYTPIGKEVVDRPLIGFTVADTPPAKRWMSYGIVGGGPDFAIPPNEPNYKSPPFDLEFMADVDLVEMMPHMHVRGKDMTYHLVYPGRPRADRARACRSTTSTGSCCISR